MHVRSIVITRSRANKLSGSMQIPFRAALTYCPYSGL